MLSAQSTSSVANGDHGTNASPGDCNRHACAVDDILVSSRKRDANLDAEQSDCAKAEYKSQVSTHCTKGRTRAVASIELRSKSGTSSSIYCSDVFPDEIYSRPPGFTFGNGTKAKRQADAADGERRGDDELNTHLRKEQAGTKHEEREIAVRLVYHASDHEEHRHPIDAKQELLARRLSGQNHEVTSHIP